MSKTIVRPVKTRADERAFFEFPWGHYRHDPYWTPPLLSMRRDILDRQHNASWEYMEGEYFLAERDGQIVGTVGAVINHRHNEYWKERIGWFGMFESLDDGEIARALLDAACNYVAGKGYTAVRGPQNFTTHEETGLQIEGFGQPLILMPYNYPYYQGLVEGAGFHKVMDVYSLYYTREILQGAGAPELLAKLAKRAQERYGVMIRPINMRKRNEEFRRFRDIYNAAWDANWGFVPMTDRELDGLVKNLGQFVDPSMAFFAEVNGEMVGFAMAVPNFNELLHKAYPRPGVPELWTMLKVGIDWKIRKAIRGLRLPLMGVVAEQRNKGVDAALIYALFQSVGNPQSQYDWMDAGWILETNPLMSIMDKYGGKRYRKHRFYEKSLT